MPVLLAVATAGLGLAACSSSKSPTSTGTTAPAGSSNATTASTAPPATGTPIYIGQIESQTSAAVPGRVTYATDTLAAWVKYTNDNGGLAGHPLKVTTLNDNADPAQGEAALTTLVSDGVVAIVGQSGDETPWAPFITKHKLPVIGGPGYSANWFTNPYYYPASTTVLSNVYGEVYAAKLANPAPKIASLLCNSAAVCQGAQAIQTASAKALGIPIVYNESASPTAVSYVPQCLAMKQAGANVVLPQGINDVVLVKDCSQQNYHPTYIDENYDLTPGQIQQNSSTLSGILGPAPSPPAFDESISQTQGYFTMMKAEGLTQYLPGGSKYMLGSSQTTIDTYDAAQVFALAVKNAAVPASQTVTSADIVRGLSMIQNNTIGGLFPNGFTYGNGTTPNPVTGAAMCFWMYKTIATPPYYETYPTAGSYQTYCGAPRL